MSASSKKKLRKEQEAVKLTEKQQAAQREAKKLNLYTRLFVVVMVALLVVAVFVGVKQTITTKGILEKNTVAMTVGDHEINNVEMNYFYMDSVNSFYSSYGSYASMFGLDVTQPLNAQIVDETTGQTWADDFLTSAKENVKAAYAMSDAAEAAGYALSEEEQSAIDTELATLDLYAAMYGYSSADAYLKAFYGNGADTESYAAYAKLRALADSYYSHYSAELTYDEAALDAAEAENPGAYSSYSFHSYYIASSRFLTDDENATSEAKATAAKEAAETILAAEVGNVEALDEVIAALEINEGTEAASTAYTDTLFSSLNSAYADWMADESRTEGDVEMFANESTADGVTTVNGYYVVYYIGSNANEFPLANVRHILVTPEHNHEDGEEHDDTETYSEEELAAAKATAEEILTEWKSGAATEESFAELANAKSADGDGTTGGLYENVYPGQMVTNFNDWCFDEARKAGDTGIVESEYGYHVMFYVGDSALSYRNYQIENELRSADLSSWYSEAVESMSVNEGDTKYVNMDLVLSPAA